MLINEVQYKVGLTKKSIRYYESEGLLNVKRNNNNDYREYSEDDIKTLKTIKFLRELNVPISDLKKLKNKEITLEKCLKEQLKKMEMLEKNFEKVKNMCSEIIDKKLEYDDMDIDKYFLEMNVLNKKGFTLKDEKKKDQKKILGACLSSLISSLFFIAMIALFTWVYVTEEDFPLLFYLFLIIIMIFPLLGIVVNLIKRIKEIKGGEENVASKY